MIADIPSIAAQYGKSTEVVDHFRARFDEMEKEERRRQQADPTHKPNLYGFRVGERMYGIPAFAEPQCVIVSGSDDLQVMQWGLIPASAKPADVERYNKQNLFKNARAEHLFDKWPWRVLWSRKRCVIPTTGFYEPHRNAQDKAQYYFIKLRDREMFSLAGLWDTWVDPRTGESAMSFVMITTAANPLLRKIHNGGNNPFRMPKILTDEQEKAWLDPDITSREEVEALLTVYPEDNMIAWPVKPKMDWGNPYDPAKIDEANEI